MFDFTTGMDAPELEKVQQFLIRMARLNDPVTTASDQIFIAARQLEGAAKTPRWTTARAKFTTACNHYLAQTSFVPKEMAPVGRPTTKPFDIASATTALADFSALLPLSECPWFVISGTFLGLIREDGFLAHDYDIDIGIMVNDLNLPALLELLKKSRVFALRKCDIQDPFLSAETSHMRPTLLKVMHKTGVEIDIFVHHYGQGREAANVLWHGSSLHRWENTPFALAPYQMRGVPVLGPAHADSYLTENYGDWRTPVTEFSCSTDTSNLVLVQHPSTVAVFARKMVTQYRADDPKWAALCAEMVQNKFIVQDAASPGRYWLHPELFEQV